MYNLGKYQSARRAGIRAAVALRYARGLIHDHGMWAQLTREQRAAVMHTRALAEYNKTTYHQPGRLRWEIATHRVREAAWEAAQATRQHEEEREDEQRLKRLHGRAD